MSDWDFAAYGVEPGSCGKEKWRLFGSGVSVLVFVLAWSWRCSRLDI